MSTLDEASEEIAFLARSGARVRILDVLETEGELERHQVRDRIDASRTTVGRNLDALERRGWIRRSDGRYEITPCGELIASDFFDLVETVNSGSKLQPFLQRFPVPELDVDLDRLSESDLFVATEKDPYRPVNRHVEFMQRDGRFRCMLPSIGLQSMKAARDCVLERCQRQEVIVDADVAETVRAERPYRELFSEMLETGRLEAYVYDGTIQYYLGLAPGTVQIGVEDDDGIPRALLESGDEGIAAWAESTFERYRRRAEPLGRITASNS